MGACVSSALAEMRQGDPDHAAAAELAWRRIDGSDDAGLLSQWRVQSFCWLELPRDRSLSSPSRVADALADLLDRMSFTRYAEIARGDTTRALLRTAEHSGAAFRDEAEQALQRSGIQPPDTELLSWAYRCGPSEAAAYVSVANALEVAVQVGDYVPGRSRWRQRRVDITNRVLATGRPELAGRAPYEGIVAERVLAWTRGSGSPTRERLLSGLEGRLARTVSMPEPAAAERVLRRVSRFLGVIGDGVPLTASGYLKPDVVARCVDEVGLAGEISGRSRREGDLAPVLYLRLVAQRLGLVRRYAGRMVRTPTGRAAAADATRLWREVVASLVPQPGRVASGAAQASVVVWDLLLATLLDDATWRFDDLADACHVVLNESGWRLADGRAVDAGTVGELLAENYRDVRWMGLLHERHEPHHRLDLLPAPDAAQLFLAALRHRLLHSRTLVPDTAH